MSIPAIDMFDMLGLLLIALHLPPSLCGLWCLCVLCSDVLNVLYGHDHMFISSGWTIIADVGIMEWPP